MSKQFIPKKNQPMNASNNNPSPIDTTNHYCTNNHTTTNYYYPRNKILSNDTIKVTSPRGVTDFPIYHQRAKDVTRTFWGDDDNLSIHATETTLSRTCLEIQWKDHRLLPFLIAAANTVNNTEWE